MIKFEVTWSYGQFAVADEGSDDYPDWNQEKSEAGLATTESIIALGLYEWGTATCRVRLEPPPAFEDVTRRQAEVSIRSGIVYFWGLDEPPLGFRLPLEPGRYRVTFLIGELEESDDGTWWYTDVDIYFELTELFGESSR